MKRQPNDRFIPNRTECGRTRRSFLWEVGGGFTALALVDLLGNNGFFARESKAATSDGDILAPKTPHLPTKAKHCIFLFMNGGPSQVDTFDPKPALAKYHGKSYKGKAKVGSNNRAVGFLTKSAFQFHKHGGSGLEISDLFPHTAKHADDLCVIRSMYADTASHSSG